jgi:hypothetical protein
LSVSINQTGPSPTRSASTARCAARVVLPLPPFCDVITIVFNKTSFHEYIFSRKYQAREKNRRETLYRVWHNPGSTELLPDRNLPRLSACQDTLAEFDTVDSTVSNSDIVEGFVEAANDRGIKVAGEWRNVSRFTRSIFRARRPRPPRSGRQGLHSQSAGPQRVRRRRPRSRGRGACVRCTAQQPDATPEQRAALPILRERIRLHVRLSANRSSSRTW